MSPHGNPEMPASASPEVKSVESQNPSPVVSTSSTNDRPVVEPVETQARPVVEPAESQGRNAWGLWEVFVRSSRGLSHVHAGSLHAPDAAMALRNARDLYTRRNEGVSIWVVPADAIAASDPDAKGSFFESPQGKDYRHATYYTKSEGVKHL
ncbi:ring-1,2-phenylacetyl-CoA epoxidase subunit PaaB [Pseudarthrobacter sp. W1I19]|uniref:1,2-phenylacetyl-CoA epoxidase subunit PaaB n=1 Tax=Pseudarthrobacter sp. W1I19 TaxID=3042288 RepID=UPI002789C3A5|nr:1,2-phenylacetyl-CoA epoxidase subunit PaaB [Pseudarthrobacter sp. W1I19]MDQ0922259.1 ring-1,2-phenylacetyl-CoA epoxidase subunit PaaB [Pseudarthrobacter sp. W1I19]